VTEIPVSARTAQTAQPSESPDQDIALAREHGLPTRLCLRCGRVTRHLDTALHAECAITYAPRPIPRRQR
jgi:hypothetical protein